MELLNYDSYDAKSVHANMNLSLVLFLSPLGLSVPLPLQVKNWSCFVLYRYTYRSPYLLRLNGSSNVCKAPSMLTLEALCFLGPETVFRIGYIEFSH